MKTATKRMIIAAGALAAAGVFGSLPYDGKSLAQDGVPVQPHDVALVDVTSANDPSTILTPETGFDTTLYNDVLGPTGAEEQLYNSLVTALGASEAQYLLDTNTAEPVFSGR